MRLGKYVMIAAAVTVGACEETTAPEPNPSRVLLEIEYINYAWVATYAGFFIDAKGDIYSYDREGAPWPYGERQVLTEQQLNEKFEPKRTLVSSRNGEEVATVATRISQLNPDQLSARKGECADAGVLTYRAYKYNAAARTYEPVLLRAEGDLAQQNTSGAGQELIAYVRSLGLFNEMPGCDP